MIPFRNDSTGKIICLWIPWVVALLFITAISAASLYQSYVVIIVACISAALIVMYQYPMTAICILTFIYPLGTPELSVALPSGERIIVYVTEVFAIALAALLVIYLLARRHPTQPRLNWFKTTHVKWLVFAIAIFLGWGLVSVIRSDRPVTATYGLYRFVAALITIAFIIVHVNSWQRFIQVMIFHCSAALLYAAAALYATHYVVQDFFPLFSFCGSSVTFHYALLNLAAGSETSIAGLVPGFGVCAKHDLSMFMISATLFALYLIRITRNRWIHAAMGIFSLLYITILFQAFSKLTMLGSIITVASLTLIVKPLRRSALTIFAVFLLLNIAGFSFSMMVRPTFTKTTASTSARLKEVSSKSRFDASSLTGRTWIWKRTIKKIIETKGLGVGPDGLFHDAAYGYPTGHNLFLSVAAEYGLPCMILLILILLAVIERAYRIVLSRPRTRDPIWSLQLVMVAAVLAALVEYSFDMPIYRQQLWYMLGLLTAALNLIPERRIEAQSVSILLAHSFETGDLYRENKNKS